jgi:REase_DpnII-MboI
MNKPELKYLETEIKKSLNDLEVTFWETYVDVHDYEFDDRENFHPDYEKEDNETWLFHSTRRLFYKICLFLELKELTVYLEMFKLKFSSSINDAVEVRKSRGPLYSEIEPSMIILDDFRDFLSPLIEFGFEEKNKIKFNKLKLILENTNQILSKTKTKVTNETSIYLIIKWFINVVYPSSRSLNKARFIEKFKTYQPDILIPEISSAIEYKYIRKGSGLGNYIDQLKTDADNYKDDDLYRFFYAIVVFEDKSEINHASFQQGIKEKRFPENWEIIAL